ncbi:synaptic vesicle 2-related protein [Trichonephila clavipes]|uniref:Synaptic vesicle 2-related protein n=1 Tax=Trichonephila clavipes TaxID=2585209 RepID=A0A8X6S3S1_TRICX|nr:synaptic vesicle 2-related protein [Trichonephila clavipes]
MTENYGLKILNGAQSEKKVPIGNDASKNSGALTFTVDDAVNKAGYGKFQIRLLILAGIGWTADACEIFILSVIGDFLACDWPMHRWQIALLTSIVFVGIMVGSPVFGILADIYGRKKSIAGSLALLFVFGAVSAAAPSYQWMVVFRACMGFAVGGLASGLTLCTEYCPTHMRGKAGLYLCYFWSFGTCGVTLVAWLVMDYLDSWRILLVVVSLPSLIVVLVIKWYPESARYYLVSNQRDRAVKILQQMATMNGTELPPGQLVQMSEEHKRGRVQDLLSKEYRLSSVLFWYIWLATAFSYYGIALVSPIIIQHGSLLGIDDANNTNETLFQDMKFLVPCSRLTDRNYIDLLWTSAAEFPGLLAFTILVERCNRKVLLGSSCVIGSVLVVLLLVKAGTTVTLVLLFAARGILLAVFQLIFIVTSETYPTTIRSVAMGFGSAFCRVGGLIVPYVAQVLVVDSPIAAMCLIAGVLFLAGIASAFLPFETRGAKMKEIQSSS